MSIIFSDWSNPSKKDASNFKKVLTFHGLYDIILISYPMSFCIDELIVRERK